MQDLVSLEIASADPIDMNKMCLTGYSLQKKLDLWDWMPKIIQMFILN